MWMDDAEKEYDLVYPGGIGMWSEIPPEYRAILIGRLMQQIGPLERYVALAMRQMTPAARCLWVRRADKLLCWAG